MTEFFRKYSVIVLLTIWVALLLCLRLLKSDPFAPQEVLYEYHPMQEHAVKIRNKLETRLDTFAMAPAEKALIESLVLGDRHGLQRDQRLAFQDAGAMHVLAVSGLHVGIVRDIICQVLLLGGLLYVPYEKRRWKRMIWWVTVAGVWTYAFLTGFSTSVIRAAIMFTLLPIDQRTSVSAFRFNRLAAAALLILIFRPTDLFSVGFLLSFSAVLSLMVYCPRWEKRFGGGRLKNLLYASVAAQIGTLPWTLYFFGQTANYFFLTNLIVIPLSGMLIVCSFLCISFTSVPLLGASTAWLAEHVAWVMNESVRFIQQLPGASSCFTITPLTCFLLISTIFFITMAAYAIARDEQANTESYSQNNYIRKNDTEKITTKKGEKNSAKIRQKLQYNYYLAAFMATISALAMMVSYYLSL
ncbi:MAG: ComEC/Rec2 family competence protein [Paludibacteraceae bacterium]|nr:ComEC/Rec2 family competence protein [Paludibacteraceae bacterium]